MYDHGFSLGDDIIWGFLGEEKESIPADTGGSCLGVQELGRGSPPDELFHLSALQSLKPRPADGVILCS